MRFSQRRGLLGGLALLMCAAVLLAIVIRRLYVVVLGHPAALAADMLPLLGLALGGAFALLLPSRPSRLVGGLAYLACVFSVGSTIAMIVLVQPRWGEAVAAPSPGRLAALYASSLLPFIASGAAIARVARHASTDIGKLALASLAGASIGVLAAGVALLPGGPRAGLIASVIAGVAAIVLYSAARSPHDVYAQDTSAPEPGEDRPSGGVVATFALGAAVLLAGDVGAPWLKLPSLRWMRLERVELQAWSPRSLITTERAIGGIAGLQTDGTAREGILEAKKLPDPHPAEIAYALHKDGKGPVLVIGAGGGADIRRALKAGQTEIHASEAEPVVIADVMRGKYRELTGDLYDRPEVRVTHADGRSFVRTSKTAYRAIILPLDDSTQPLSTGALALTESRVYTVEAFRDFLERLAPDGTLLVSRFDTDVDRLLSLAAAGLRSVGIASPKDHLFACSLDRTTSLLIKRSPFTKDDLTTLRSTCKRSRFQEVFAPDVQRSDLRRRLVALPSARDAAPGHPTDLSAPTDDRPFFFSTAPAHLVPKALASPLSLVKTNEGLFAAVLSLAASLLVTLLLFFVPLATSPARVLFAADRGARLRALLFFATLGAATVLASIALARHAAIILGHPVHGEPIAVAMLLLSAGLGAVLSDPVHPSSLSLAAGRRAQLLTALLAVYAVAYTIGAGIMLRSATPLPLVARLAAVAVIQVPLGLLLGSLAPLGVRLVAAREPVLLPWCAGMWGASGAVAIVVAKLLAMHLGYSSLLIASGLAYLLAAAFVPPAVAAGTPSLSAAGGPRSLPHSPSPSDVALAQDVEPPPVNPALPETEASGEPPSPPLK
jgi:spermidine synthase